MNEYTAGYVMALTDVIEFVEACIDQNLGMNEMLEGLRLRLDEARQP